MNFIDITQISTYTLNKTANPLHRDSSNRIIIFEWKIIFNMIHTKLN